MFGFTETAVKGQMSPNETESGGSTRSSHTIGRRCEGEYWNSPRTLLEAYVTIAAWVGGNVSYAIAIRLALLMAVRLFVEFVPPNDRKCDITS